MQVPVGDAARLPNGTQTALYPLYDNSPLLRLRRVLVPTGGLTNLTTEYGNNSTSTLLSRGSWHTQRQPLREMRAPWTLVKASRLARFNLSDFKCPIRVRRNNQPDLSRARSGVRIGRSPANSGREPERRRRCREPAGVRDVRPRGDRRGRTHSVHAQYR